MITDLRLFANALSLIDFQCLNSFRSTECVCVVIIFSFFSFDGNVYESHNVPRTSNNACVAIGVIRSMH